MLTATKGLLRNALKFGTSGEVDSKEGVAPAEGYRLVPFNCIEVGSLQVELNGAVGEALVQQPPRQCLRTKLISNVRIDNPFFNRFRR